MQHTAQTSAQLDDLFHAAQAELDGLVRRMSDNVIWTAREIRLAEWLTSKAVLRQDAASVSIVVPSGRANEKLGYLLYACLERAADTAGLIYQVEGYTNGNVHGLKLI